MHHNFLPYWLPLTRVRKLFHRPTLEIRLEVRRNLVLPRRNIAKGDRPVLLQCIADVVREWITVFTIHRDTATVFVRELGFVRCKNMNANPVDRLMKGNELYIGQANSCFKRELFCFRLRIDAWVEANVSRPVFGIATLCG